MSTAPLPPSCELGGAAEIERDLEYPVSRFSVAQTEAQVAEIDDIRFQLAVARLHKLGPRPLFEMLIELGAQYLLRTEIDAAVNRFAEIDPVLLDAAGGRDFAPVPLHGVVDAR